MDELNQFIAYSNADWNDTFENPINFLPRTRINHKDGKGFFHYTTLSNCIKILELKKENHNQKSYISLYASHFLFLNDEQEFFDGLKIILNEIRNKISVNNDLKMNERLEKYLEKFLFFEHKKIYCAPNHFILCFCSSGNLLSQWEWYGKECGVAIEFDLEGCTFSGMEPYGDNLPNRPIDVFSHKVIYDNDKNQKSEIIKNILDYQFSSSWDSEIKADVLAMRAIAAASFMKHSSFKDEREIRLLFSPMYHIGKGSQQDAIKQIKYIDNGRVLKPYLDIHIRHKANDIYPIKSVTIGPGHDQLLVFNSMIKLVQTRFFPEIKTIPDIITDCIDKKFYEYTTIGNIEVRRSTIPFRS